MSVCKHEDCILDMVEDAQQAHDDRIDEWADAYGDRLTVAERKRQEREAWAQDGYDDDGFTMAVND